MQKEKQVPFILGIGGSGMSSLAHIYLDMDIPVYGYDKSGSEVVETLKKRGATIFQTIEPSLEPSRYTHIIYSSAIHKQTNPFYLHFEKAGKLFFHRSEIVKQLFSSKDGIAVAGSHGKTTTTAMIGFILESLGEDPSIMVGGDVPFLGNRGGKNGKGQWGVYEADESDGTFLSYTPKVKVITNIDNDHLDYYKTEEALVSAFVQFIQNNSDAICILNIDDPGIQKAISCIHNFEKIITYSETSYSNQQFKKHHSIKIQDTHLTFIKNSKTYTIQVPYPGKHYLLNAYSAFLACDAIGLDTESILKALREYTGVKRRMELLGEWKGVKVFDDYGHHPTEISAVIGAISQKTRSYSVLFQPHRYTRTRDLYKQFAEVLDKANKVFLLPIYSAGEEPIAGISSELIYDTMRHRSNVTVLSGKISEDVGSIRSQIVSTDIFLCIGAGNVRQWGLQLITDQL
jgi:UDP-N-acetylmuramate--alanine ligase